MIIQCPVCKSTDEDDFKIYHDDQLIIMTCYRCNTRIMNEELSIYQFKKSLSFGTIPSSSDPFLENKQN